MHNHTLCIFHGIYCRYKGGPHRSRAVVLYTYYVVIYVLCILGKETCSRLPGPQASRFLCIRIMSIKHFMLTHWGRVTHICVIKLTIIGSDNLDNYLNQCWNIVNKIRPLGTNFSEILIEILIFSFKKMRLKVSSAKRRPFCLGLNVLTHWCLDKMDHFAYNILKGINLYIYLFILITSINIIKISRKFGQKESSENELKLD